MKKRVSRSLTVLGLAGLMLGVLAVPVNAGGPQAFDPSLTVVKTVTKDAKLGYDIPNGSLFTIQVACVGSFAVDAQGPSGGLTATLTFNGDGTTHSAPGGWVDGGKSWTYQGRNLSNSECTIAEQAGGAAQYLASDPTYACVFTNEAVVDDLADPSAELVQEKPGCVSTNGPKPSVVRFGFPWDGSCPPPADAITKGDGLCYACVQSATVTVTNPIGNDPVKVKAAEASATTTTTAAPAAAVVQPKFTG